MGGDKAAVLLEGRPLLAYPVTALREVASRVVVVAKHDTAVPPVDGVDLWVEGTREHHPLHGIVHALRCAGRREVVVCAVDLPLVTGAVLRRLLAARGRPGRTVVACAAGRPQPLCAVYAPSAAAPLERAAASGEPVLDAVAALDPLHVEVGEDRLLNVNAPEDLLRAGAILSRRS
jgi:molybdenum cofactor guanylyltransferase